MTDRLALRTGSPSHRSPCTRPCRPTVIRDLATGQVRTWRHRASAPKPVDQPSRVRVAPRLSPLGRATTRPNLPAPHSTDPHSASRCDSGGAVRVRVQAPLGVPTRLFMAPTSRPTRMIGGTFPSLDFRPLRGAQIPTLFFRDVRSVRGAARRNFAAGLFTRAISTVHRVVKGSISRSLSVGMCLLEAQNR